jgi:hypothetical protein
MLKAGWPTTRNPPGGDEGDKDSVKETPGHVDSQSRVGEPSNTDGDTGAVARDGG